MCHRFRVCLLPSTGFRADPLAAASFVPSRDHASARTGIIVADRAELVGDGQLAAGKSEQVNLAILRSQRKKAPIGTECNDDGSRDLSTNCFAGQQQTQKPDNCRSQGRRPRAEPPAASPWVTKPALSAYRQARL